jgi:uncharacterized protein (DUF2336 family)
MTSPIIANLDGLADLGSRSGIDVRPTLMRVLTDLYVHKLTHTPDEERHYTELALRLIEAVDVPTRAAVAQRLAAYPNPPPKVIARLARDLPEVAAPLQRQIPRRPAHQGNAERAARGPKSDARANDAPHEATVGVPEQTWPANAAVAHELNELFLGAGTEERRLILLNLEIVTAAPPRHLPVANDPTTCAHLEAAALARDIERFVRHFARALHIGREQALRIVRDELGDAVVVAAKVLRMPADMLQRILLFLNPSVGHSVDRVHALANLYEEVTLPAAEHLLAIWQALPQPERPAAEYRPLLWNDETPRVRDASPARHREPRARTPQERRSAS